MDPDRPNRALNYEKSCVSFFDLYYGRIDRMSAVAAEMTQISEHFRHLEETCGTSRQLAAAGFTLALVLWLNASSVGVVTVGPVGVAVVALATGGAAFVFLSRQQAAVEERVRRMASLAKELRALVQPLVPKLYDVYSASVFEGSKVRSAKLLRHSARLLELLTVLNGLREDVDTRHMAEVAEQSSRAVQGLCDVRSRMMCILES